MKLKEILRPVAQKQITHDIQGNIKLKVIHTLDISVWHFREKSESYHTYLRTPALQKLFGWPDFLIALDTRRDSQEVNTDQKVLWNEIFPG